MAYVAPKTYTVGEVLTAADMNTYQRDNISQLRADSWQLLGLQRLTTGTTATFTVPTGITELDLMINGRLIADDAISVRVNGVSTADYVWSLVRWDNGATAPALAGATAAAPAAAMSVGWLGGGTGRTGRIGVRMSGVGSGMRNVLTSRGYSYFGAGTRVSVGGGHQITVGDTSSVQVIGSSSFELVDIELRGRA